MLQREKCLAVWTPSSGPGLGRFERSPAGHSPGPASGMELKYPEAPLQIRCGPGGRCNKAHYLTSSSDFLLPTTPGYSQGLTPLLFSKLTTSGPLPLSLFLFCSPSRSQRLCSISSSLTDAPSSLCTLKSYSLLWLLSLRRHPRHCSEPPTHSRRALASRAPPSPRGAQTSLGGAQPPWGSCRWTQATRTP